MPTATHTFRVFVSSTFEDLKEERNALQSEVFPELKKLCELHGARFQAIDLRWGLRDEAVRDQKTMEICLREIERCQCTGIKPNFVVLLGERYGWLPLASRIDGREFEAILGRITKHEDRALVERWYRRDANAVPPEYVLKARTRERIDADRWSALEVRLHQILNEAARSAGLSSKEMIKYEASATHQEILAGLGQTQADRQHIFAFFRRPEGETDERLKELKVLLRLNLPGNIVEFDAGDTAMLCHEAASRLKKVIEEEVKHFEDRPALDLEVQAHDRFAEDRAHIFTGRKAVLRMIAQYIGGIDRQPLVLHGAPGSGKSAVMAKASEQCKNLGKIIRRFIGASSASTSGHSLLTSLCQQISPGETPVEFQQLENAFVERLGLATKQEPLVVFIDALDQLADGDPAQQMTWLPRELPRHAKVILSTTPRGDLLPSGRHVVLEHMREDEGEQVLAEWLLETGRTLQPAQRAKVLTHFVRCGLPLYLKLAAEEGKRWPSYATDPECALGEGIAGIIDTLFDRLSSDANHGHLMVARSLGYLVTGRYGLTEDEILEVLSNDNDVWSDFDQRKHHEVKERRLPVAVWSRLHLDLEPYLTECEAPGGTVITFYHRQLAERAAERLLAGDELRLRHEALARHYSQKPFWLDADRELPNARKTAEWVYQLAKAHWWAKAEQSLMHYTFLSAKCTAGMIMDLNADYELVFRGAPKASLPQRDVLDLIAGSLRLSLHALIGDLRQLPSQLTGRLLGLEAPSVRDLLKQVVGETRIPWLRPLWATLNQPGAGLIRTLSGHSEVVEDVALSADGRRAVSASKDKTLKVWDLDTGIELRTLAGHADYVNGVAVSADGRRAVSASHDKTLKMWDLDTGHELCTLVGHSGSVSGVVASADWRRAVSASWDKTVKVWDLETGHAVRTLYGHSDTVYGVAMSADGRQAVSASYDKTLKVWDLETGRELRTLVGHSGSVNGVAMSPDGRRVVSASSDNTLKVWDLETGRELRTLAGALLYLYGAVYCVAVSADGRRAVSASSDKTLSVWDLEIGRMLGTREGADTVSSVAMSADGRRAVSASWDKTVKVWDLDARREPRMLKGHSDSVEGVAASGDGRRAVSVSRCCELKVWDLETGRELGMVLWDVFSYFSSVAASADGRFAVSGSTNGVVTMWDLEIVLAPTKYQSGAVSSLYGHSASVSGVAVSADGRRAVSASHDKTLKVWDLETRGELRTLAGHADYVSGVAVSANWRRAVSASWDKTLKVWDLETGGELRSLVGHADHVSGVAVSADGRRAVSASKDKTLKVWDLETGSGLHTLAGHADYVSGVAVSADGRRAVSASKDKRVKVWDLETGESVATFTCDAEVVCCAFAAAGILIAGDAAGRLHFLSLEPLQKGWRS